MEFSKVKVDKIDSIAVITLNDPDTLNAMDITMCEGLKHALTMISDPASGVRCAVLTGAGRGFSSGANLAGGNDPGSSTAEAGMPDAGAVLESHFNPLIEQLHHLDIPLITAVNGVAAGVGMSFALCGDLILASEHAYFLQAFTRIGLVPDGGSTWLLPRLVGLARARELSLLADKLPAATALQWGLINRVHSAESLMDEALILARRLAEGPTEALGLTRRLYAQSPENTLAEQLDLERRYQRVAGHNPDVAEGAGAFLQKRPARFSGQRSRKR